MVFHEIGDPYHRGEQTCGSPDASAQRGPNVSRTQQRSVRQWVSPHSDGEEDGHDATAHGRFGGELHEAVVDVVNVCADTPMTISTNPKTQ